MSLEEAYVGGSSHIETIYIIVGCCLNFRKKTAKNNFFYNSAKKVMLTGLKMAGWLNGWIVE
jgi:hypothetical protein